MFTTHIVCKCEPLQCNSSQTAYDDHDTQNIPKELETRKRLLSEVHKPITQKQATQEELHIAESVFD